MENKYLIRIPAEITSNGYYTRREKPTRVSTAHYELYVSNFGDLTVEEQCAILDKMANIGGVGNLRVTKVGVYDSEA